MMGVSFEAGAGGRLPDHPHVQSSFVARGRFLFTRGDEEFDLRTGDSLVISSGVRHGCHCLEAGGLIDVFAPRRDDLL